MTEFQDLKNSHTGCACLVMGNGPTLTPELLDEIDKSGIFSFVANGFCTIFERSNFRPDAVCMSNYDAVERFGLEYPDKTLKFFKKGSLQKLKTDLDNLFELPFACEHDNGIHKGPYIKDGNFTFDPEKKNFCGDTVLLDFAIPVAFYMGFTRVYLAGVDCDYSHGYFSKDLTINAKPGFKSMVHGDFSIAIPGFRYATDFFKQHGRHIFKLTDSSKLEFIETISIDEFLKLEVK